MNGRGRFNCEPIACQVIIQFKAVYLCSFRNAEVVRYRENKYFYYLNKKRYLKLAAHSQHIPVTDSNQD